jgi:hypothetical protein
VSPDGSVVTLDVRDLALTDDQGGDDVVPAVTSFNMSWKGIGRQRDVTGDPPAAFAGSFFRRSTARGTFAGTAGAFSFTSNPDRPARSIFAQLGTERNGVFLSGILSCARCGSRGDPAAPEPQGAGW